MAKSVMVMFVHGAVDEQRRLIGPRAVALSHVPFQLLKERFS